MLNPTKRRGKKKTHPRQPAPLPHSSTPSSIVFKSSDKQRATMSEPIPNKKADLPQAPYVILFALKSQS